MGTVSLRYNVYEGRVTTTRDGCWFSVSTRSPEPEGGEQTSLTAVRGSALTESGRRTGIWPSKLMVTLISADESNQLSGTATETSANESTLVVLFHMVTELCVALIVIGVAATASEPSAADS